MKKITKRMCSLLLVIILVLSCVGCGNTKDDGEISLLWYIPIDSQNDTNEIFAKANEYIKEKLGFTVEFVATSIGDYDSKMQVINASRSEFDLVFTSNWLNNYEKAVKNGVLMDITELIKEHAPKTYANIPEKFWDGAKVDGKLYGVINQQIIARGPCIMTPVQNLDMNVDFESIQTWQDCAKFLEEYHKVSGGGYTYMGNLWSGLTLWHGLDELLGASVVGAYYIDDDKSDGKIEVVNQYETPEYLEYIKERRKWVENGWTESVVGDTFDYDAWVLENGESGYLPQFCVYATYKPGVEKELEATKNFPLKTTYRPEQGFVSRNGITATMTGVGAYSKHPKEALQLIELVNNDEYLFNLLTYGIEGHNYTRNEDGTVTPSTENIYSCQNWAIGNVFNSYVREGESLDVWDRTREINEAGRVSELIGFIPDISNITTEISNCTSAASEFNGVLCTGMVDVDEYYEKFLAKLKAGGCDKIVAELQRQVDEYVASSK